MKPAWAMLEYASMRFTLVCAIARMLPRTIDTAASPHTTGAQSHASAWNATSRTRIRAANAAILVAADM